MRILQRRSALINRADPQAAGLVFCAPCADVAIDVMAMEVLTRVGGVSPGLTTHGPGTTFNGTDGYLTGGVRVPTVGLPFSIMAWVRPNFSDTTTNRHMVVQRYASGGARFGSNLQWLGDLNQWRCDGTALGNCYMSDSVTPFTAGEIHHVGFTISADGTASQGYWDGRPQTTTHGANFSTTVANGDPIFIGQSGISGDGRWFNGTIWDVRLYARALSSAEWWTIYAPQSRLNLYAQTAPWWWWAPQAGGGGGTAGPLIGGPLVGRGRLGGRLVA